MALSDVLGDDDADFISIPPNQLTQPVKQFTYLKEPYVRALIPLKAGGAVTTDPASKLRRWL